MAAISFSLASLLFARQLGMWADPVNRYLAHWQRSDSVSLAAAILLTAVIGYAAGFAIAKSGPRPIWAGRVVMTFIVVEVALAQVVRIGNISIWWVNWMLPVAVYGVTGIALLLLPERTMRAASAVALILSPFGVIVLAQLLLWPPIDVRRKVGVADPMALMPTSGPVVVILFDEWSYERSVASPGTFLTPLTALNIFADSSYFFSRAGSAAPRTLYSIPQMIFQSPANPFVRKRIPWWMDKEARAISPSPKGMFSRATQVGYDVRVFGFYLPYRALAGESALEVHAEPYFPRRATFAGKVAWALERNVEMMGNPLLRVWGRRIFDRQYNRHWYELNGRLEAEVGARLANIAASDYVFAHFAPPHSPFVFGADGSYRPEQVNGRIEADPSKYQIQLRYLDRMLGTALERLRSSGRFDSTLIIVTSDHGWKAEPDATLRARARATHVPLMIRWPGQRAAVRIDERICLVGVQAVLDRYFARPLEPPSASEMAALSRQSCARPMVDSESVRH